MKAILTREQMRAYDLYAIERCSVPGIVLMENAGRGAADVIEEILRRTKEKILDVELRKNDLWANLEDEHTDSAMEDRGF